MADKFGLRNQSEIVVNYDVDQQVCTVNGSKTTLNIKASEYKRFNIPICIYVDGVPYYPSKYESVPSGICHYHSKTPPISGIILTDTFWQGDRKEYKKSIKLDKLKEYNNSSRIRTPSEYQVMGESAKKHAQKCIDMGLISILDGFDVDWHWCHLIAFSMLSAEHAQIEKNLVCGTAAFNGQMINIEQAVKHFIYRYKRHLSLEVKADIIEGTHLATRLSYSVYDKKSRNIYTEYYSPLTFTHSDIIDEEAIYNRLVSKFEK